MGARRIKRRFALQKFLFDKTLLLKKQTTYTSVLHPAEPASLVYRFMGLHPYSTGISIEANVHPSAGNSLAPSALSSYSRFRMALKSKEVERVS